jgi:type I restriction-modification system DNA methylase subunit
LGNAYEYLIGQFAAGGGKKAGEFYTPQHNYAKFVISLSVISTQFFRI